MKKIFYSLLFISVTGFSQSLDQKEIIINKSNLVGLDATKTKLIESDKNKESRINLFLSHNPLTKKSFHSEGVFYQIVDVIDNKPIYVATDNVNSAAATRTKSLLPGGDLGLNLEGENMLLGIWDGGLVRVDHVEFKDDQAVPVTRVTTPETPLPNPPNDSHATHVAGTLIAKGIDVNAKGMAPKANLVSYNWTSDISEVVSEITNNALLLSNHSYGVPVLDDEGNLNAPVWMMGCYNSDARDWDQVAFDAPYYLMVTSAGNSGADSYSGGLAEGYDKLTGEKNSKNNLVVANANPFVSPTTGILLSVPINASSSQGPSDDGRIKPDITGDGTNVYSSYNTNATSYATLTGTSMASPNVAGSLLLLQEYYNDLHGSFMRSSTIKGLVCHTARNGGSVGPDPKFGWGLLDAKNAAILMQNANDAVPTAILSEVTLNQGETFEIDVNVSTTQKLEATICWLDPVGVAKDNQLNSPTPALVNDLDIRIIKGAEINMPWKLQLSDVSAAAIKGDNTVDNVEKVEVDNALGVYTIRVTHKGTLNSGAQNFSLIASGFNSAVLSDKTFEESDKFALYPVPANDILNIATNNKLISSYSIYDSQGRIVKDNYSLKSIDFVSINIEDLSKGIYYVKIMSEGKQILKKFIKK
ncbi:S8 family serine peptidase [Flavobacterium sp. J27]|uniref:S8 family serine peptidase n=1 Tax=Flavobacterium sp. J27 TaxID=2060419 RepID=UPI001031EAE8|nr:S8 family serine peptidase [Flavobacterium sp. J27]